MIKAIWFDLDGTLLPFDRKTFEKGYFHTIANTFKNHPNCKELLAVIANSVEAMTRNESELTNEKVFIDYFSQHINDRPFEEYEQIFNHMYLNQFQQLKDICEYEPKAKELVEYVKSKGLKVICSTNPLFPKVCTESRLLWAGLTYDDFDFVTTYENSVSAKPNPYYFQWLLNKFNLEPEEVILIGNDAIEDGAALQLGIQVYLVNRCLENKDLVNSLMFIGTMDEIKDKLKEVLE